MNDLVIAFYLEKEELHKFKKFSEKYKYNTYIYNKGYFNISDNWFKTIDLPNKGLHCHSYLYHIVHNYDRLSDVTIFMLGSGFRGKKKENKAKWLLHNANKCKGFMAQHIWKASNEDYDFELPFYDILDYTNKSLHEGSNRIKTKMIRADITPCGAWIEKYTTKDLKNNFLRTNKCMFAVTRDLIHEFPLSYWERLLNLLEIYQPDQRNLEVTHYFERAWLSLFVKKPTLQLLNYDRWKYGKISDFKN